MNITNRKKISTSFFQSNVGEFVEIRVQIIKARYESEEGFGVYDTQLDSKTQKNLVVVGTFPGGARIGNYYKLQGIVAERNGERQLQVEESEVTFPTDPFQEEFYLSRFIVFRWDIANALSEAFPGKVFDKLLYHPDDLINHPDIIALNVTRKDIMEYRDTALYKAEINRSIAILVELGLDKKAVSLALKKIPQHEIADFEVNPYAILNKGVGAKFTIVDKVALNKGFQLKFPTRLLEATKYALWCIVSTEGDTYAESGELWDKLSLVIGTPLGAIESRNIVKEALSRGLSTWTVTVGANTHQIDIADLKQSLEDWQEIEVYSRSSFSYPLFQIDDTTIREAIDLSIHENLIVKFKNESNVDCYQFKRYYQYETSIAQKLVNINNFDSKRFTKGYVEQCLEEALLDFGTLSGKPVILEPEQREAILTICTSPYGAFLLTGPAGSGKTFVMSIILHVMEKLFHNAMKKNHEVRLLAPTGVAATVLKKSIEKAYQVKPGGSSVEGLSVDGLKASTIHKEFRIGPEASNSLNMNAEAPIEIASMYVVDEFSMVDELVLAKMLKELPNDVKIVFSGDWAQLPSVGAGSCLRDVMNSGVITWVHLNTVKRQDGDSGILQNANKIIAGESISTITLGKPDNKGDSYIHQFHSKEESFQFFQDYINNTPKSHFLENRVQILCPTKGSILGTDYLNYVVQQVVNPVVNVANDLSVSLGTSLALPSGGTAKPRIHIGDKVINTQNNYKAMGYKKQGTLYQPVVQRGVMNGEVGVVVDILDVNVNRSKVRRVIVLYDDMYVFFDGNLEFGNLDLAYAITVHKSQGSQWPVVLAPFVGSFEQLYTKALIYTVFTRAVETCHIAGTMHSINKSISNDRIGARKTRLEQQLRIAYNT